MQIRCGRKLDIDLLNESSVLTQKNEKHIFSETLIAINDIKL